MNKIMCLVIFIIMLSTSCDPVYQHYTTVSVDNKTNKEYLIYVSGYTGNIIKSVVGNTYTIINKFDGGKTIGGVNPENRHVYIYDVKDSLYVHFRSIQRLDASGNIKENESNFVTYSQKSTIIDKEECIEYNFIYTINENLLLQMTKNTALTDSIFKLKK
jgi:hypothetical protein